MSSWVREEGGTGGEREDDDEDEEAVKRGFAWDGMSPEISSSTALQWKRGGRRRCPPLMRRSAPTPCQ